MNARRSPLYPLIILFAVILLLPACQSVAIVTNPQPAGSFTPDLNKLDALIRLIEVK